MVTEPSYIQYIMERSCLRKTNLTLEQANRIVDQSVDQGRVMYFYKCEFCNSYHMTKNPPYSPKEPIKLI